MTDADERAAEARLEHRTMMFPIAIGMIVGLLIGFGGGFGFGMRYTRRTAEAPASAQPRENAQETPESTAATPPAAKPYSEQAVSPPAAPAAAPGVPAESPGAAPPRTPSTSRSIPEASRNGRIVVRSVPAGASVTVNGQWRGRTPLTLSGVPLGNYVVRIVATGYDVEREEFALTSAAASRDISVRLERQRSTAPPATSPGQQRGTPAAVPTPSSKPFTGSIFVDSRPRAARVFIDGREVGTTPMRIPEVGIGTHVIRLELPDHRTWSSSVRVASGVESRVTGSLEPIR